MRCRLLLCCALLLLACDTTGEDAGDVSETRVLDTSNGDTERVGDGDASETRVLDTSNGDTERVGDGDVSDDAVSDVDPGETSDTTADAGDQRSDLASDMDADAPPLQTDVISLAAHPVCASAMLEHREGRVQLRSVIGPGAPGGGVLSARPVSLTPALIATP